jgi:hypothetical protein
MADKKLALELLINVQNGNLTLEELNEQLAKAKEQLEEIGDKGSQEFKELNDAIMQTEDIMKNSSGAITETNKNVEQLNKNLDATANVSENVSTQLSNSQARYKELSSTIEEQKDILIEFQQQLVAAQRAEANGDKAKLGRQKILKDRTQALKDAIRDQRVALQDLNNQRAKEKATIKDLTKQSVNYTKIQRGIDKLTGGMATKVVKLYKGFREGTKLLKGFVSGLSKFQKALIGTGIGAFVVALGVVAAYWDDIVALIDGGNKKLEKQLKQNQDYGDELDHQLTLLELEEQILEQQGLNTEHIVAEQKKVLLLKQEQIQRDIELLELQQKRLIQQGLEPSLLMKITESMTGYKAVVGDVSEEEKEAIEANKDRIKEAEENAKKLELALKKIDADKKKRDTKSANEEKKAQEKADKEAERLAKEKEKALEEIRKGKIVTRQQELDEELLQVDRYYKDLIAKANKYNEDTEELEKARLAKRKEIEDAEKARKEKEAEDEAKRILKEKEDRVEELEEQKVIDEENFAARRTEIDRREKLILQDKIITEEQRSALLQSLAAERKQLKEDELAVDEQVEAAKFQMAKDVFTGISNLASLFASENEASARKQFELNKALSIGQTIIATYEGAQNAYRTAQKSPYQAINPAYAPIQAGLAIVAGLAQVKKISSTQFKSKSVDTTTSPVGGQLGGGDIGTQPRGFLTPTIDTGAETTKVIVTETDIRNVSRNVDGVYSRATVVQ